VKSFNSYLRLVAPCCVTGSPRVGLVSVQGWMISRSPNEALRRSLLDTMCDGSLTSCLECWYKRLGDSCWTFRFLPPQPYRRRFRHEIRKRDQEWHFIRQNLIPRPPTYTLFSKQTIDGIPQGLGPSKLRSSASTEESKFTFTRGISVSCLPNSTHQQHTTTCSS
jgi:hypothetical protein